MKDRLKGGQQSFFEERAYGVACGPARFVLCDMHVDLYRVIMKPRTVSFTGETFPFEDCEHCASVRKQA